VEREIFYLTDFDTGSGERSDTGPEAGDGAKRLNSTMKNHRGVQSFLYGMME